MTTTLKPSEQEDGLSRSMPKRQGCFGRAYEWFLNLPVPIVLLATRLTRVALISVSMLGLYLFWSGQKEVRGDRASEKVPERQPTLRESAPIVRRVRAKPRASL
jgi:hypothetical protein